MAITLQDILQDIESYVEDNFPELKEPAEKTGLFWTLHYSSTSKLAKDGNNKFEKNFDVPDIEGSLDKLYRGIERLCKHGHNWIIIQFKPKPTDPNPQLFSFRNPEAGAKVGSVANPSQDNFFVTLMQQNFQMQLALIEKNNDLKFENYKKEVEMDKKMDEMAATIGALQEKPEPKGFIGKVTEMLEKNKTVQGIAAALIAKIAGVDLASLGIGNNGEKNTDDADAEETNEEMSPLEKLDKVIVDTLGEENADESLEALTRFIRDQPEVAKGLLMQIKGAKKHGQ